jgi:hypothetical protein
MATSFSEARNAIGRGQSHQKAKFAAATPCGHQRRFESMWRCVRAHLLDQADGGKTAAYFRDDRPRQNSRSATDLENCLQSNNEFWMIVASDQTSS